MLNYVIIIQIIFSTYISVAQLSVKAESGNVCLFVENGCYEHGALAMNCYVNAS